MTRIGIFGGTFDPPHIGHLILADEALTQLSLDRLLWVLTPNPPHKRDQAITRLALRLEMLEAVISQDQRFEISHIDMDRQGPHYALDTVNLLAEKLPGAQLVYLIGGDSLRDLPHWHEPQRFINALFALGVMRRPGDAVDLAALEADLPGISSKVKFVEAPLLEIASHQIRERIASGSGYRYYLPPQVYRIIEREQLYRQPQPDIAKQQSN